MVDDCRLATYIIDGGVYSIPSFTAKIPGVF
jgi:hypothetical protein